MAGANPSDRRPRGDSQRRPGMPERGDAVHPALGFRPAPAVRALRITGYAAGLLAAGVAVYAGYWFLAAHQMRDATLAWAAARQAAGDELRWRSAALSGFPGTITLSLAEPQARTAGSDGSVAWGADHLLVTMNPFTPGRVVLSTSGRQDMAVAAGGLPRRYQGSVRSIEVPLVLGRRGVQEVTVRVQDLSLVSDAGEDLAVVGAAAHFEDLTSGTADHLTTSRTLRLDATGVKLPASLQLPLGHQVTRISVSAELKGQLPPGPPAQSLPVWRDSGGTLEILHLLADYGPLTVDANGTLSLDKAMQPIGALSGQVGGLFETIDRLRDLGQVRSRDATTAKLVLGALARRDASGRQVVDVPLTIQDRILSVGPVRVLEVPEIVWPGGGG